MYQRQNAVFVLWAVSVVVIAFFLIPGIAPRLVITDFCKLFSVVPNRNVWGRRRSLSHQLTAYHLFLPSNFYP